jgi:ribosomal protein S27AE
MPEKSSKSDKFCPACGNGLIVTAVICPKCGSPVAGVATKGSREKSIAVIMAVFLSSWAYLYTYKYDAKKFWISTIAGTAPLIISVIAFTVYEISYDEDVYVPAEAIGTLFSVVWFFAALAIWITAIVVTATRDDSQYKNY